MPGAHRCSGGTLRLPGITRSPQVRRSPSPSQSQGWTWDENNRTADFSSAQAHTATSLLFAGSAPEELLVTPQDSDPAPPVASVVADRGTLPRAEPRDRTIIVEISAPECAADTGSLCQWIWENTGLDVVARNSDQALSAILHILLILVIAVIVRFLLYRAINRLTKITINGATPTALQPLRAQVGRALARGQSTERRAQRTRAIGSLLKSISSFAVVCIAAILILAELGIDIAPLLTSAGIAGVALAFGAQNLVRDFLAGIFMTLEDQYGVGDTVDLGSATGTVIDVSLRTTTVRAGDGTIWHVRNGEILRVGNSSQGEAVVTIELPMRYDADTDAAGTLALEEATRIAELDEYADSVVAAPKLVGIVSVAPGMVTLGIAVTIRAGDQDTFLRAVRAAIRAAFEQARRDDPAADYRPPVIAGTEPA